MKIDAISVTSSDVAKTISFYTLLGFIFPEHPAVEAHVEAITKPGEVRFMIDKKEIIAEILGYEPQPSNYSGFALLAASPEEVNTIAAAVAASGFTVVKEPWDAFWGQRYAILKDPDGYMVDIFADLK